MYETYIKNLVVTSIVLLQAIKAIFLNQLKFYILCPVNEIFCIWFDIFVHKSQLFYVQVLTKQGFVLFYYREKIAPV